MPNDSMFFEIAAGLLPALMLAGLLSDKLKPPEAQEGEGVPAWPFWVIFIGGGFFVLAEVLAITAAISGNPSTLDRVTVSVALILAALSIVALLLLPWIQSEKEASASKERLPPRCCF